MSETSPHDARPAPVREVCVAYLLRGALGGDEVLLGEKRRGLGEGLLVGLGGKLEPGEAARDAVVREVREESGLRVEPADLEEIGVVDYWFPTKPEWSQRSHVFLAREFRGRLLEESEELVPGWHQTARLPVHRMWSDAMHWLPRALAGAPIRAEFVFGDDLRTVVASSDPVAGLPPVEDAQRMSV
ncbi:8-oxo-dGTP diphosphatase [Pseudoclavibacter triregionum]|nr:8-oxo-dGTP diphosphatase [Pseudoclavibacter triregionum]